MSAIGAGELSSGVSGNVASGVEGMSVVGVGDSVVSMIRLASDAIM